MVSFFPNCSIADEDSGRWDDRFAWAVVGGPQVLAATTSGTNVYFGGSFTTVAGSTASVGAIQATNIAWWNGRSWAPVGLGINGQVNALVFNGNDLYVGGEFTSAGGVAATNLARWDGTNWWAVGGGVNDVVYALTVHGGKLYVGGAFSVAGGTTVKRIAQWDGSGWSALGAGLGNVGSVRAIAFVGSEMYASGDFYFLDAGLNTVRTIAKWDGANWSRLSGDLGTTSDTAYALAVIGTDLYVGGTFLTAGGVTAKRVAKWNGSWSSLGTGITASSVGVFTMLANGTNLYVAGQIAASGGVSTANISKWDGANWSALGLGINGPVQALAMAGNDLYAGGAFLGSVGLNTYTTARWDGTRWWALGQGMDNAVFTLAVSGTHVYAGGWFHYAGGTNAGTVARWDGQSWSSLGGGDLTPEVNALAVSGTNVFVGGGFTSVYTNGFAFTANRIARWNGSAWSTLGIGMRSTGAVVRALAVAPDGALYAGGSFNGAGQAAATNIARWVTNWTALGTGANANVNGEVRALAFVGNDLFVGGSFTIAGSVSANGIARWDGANWSTVGTGLTGAVYALAAHGTELYAAGMFTNVVVGATNIAKWDGSNWSPLGSGIGGASQDFIAAIALKDSDVYAGGSFTNAGGTFARNIARWNGSTWSALGDGVDLGTALQTPAVYALGVQGDEVYVGGTFITAGGKPSYGFGIYHEPADTTLHAELAISPAGTLIFTWTSVPGRTYQILSTPTLKDPFAPFSNIIPATGSTTSYSNPPTVDSARFFRIQQLN
jgi:hypothetical protein